MKTRTWLLAASLAGSLLAGSLVAGSAAGPSPHSALADPAPIEPAAAGADTPTVTAVRQFLDARAAGRYSEAYEMLSFDALLNTTEKEF